MTVTWDPWWIAVAAGSVATIALATLWERRQRRGCAGLDVVPAETDARRHRRCGGGWRWLPTLACGLLLLALLRPRWGLEERPALPGVGNVWLCLDVSRSMLVRDVAGSRLERGKELLAELSDQVSDRPAGLLAFAGEARIVCPPTFDRPALRQAIVNLSIDSAPPGGSDLVSPFRLLAAPNQAERATDVVVLVSDGGGSKSDSVSAAALAEARGLVAVTIGIGDPGHASAVPDPQSGGLLVEQGSIVRSRLEEAPLVRLARGTGGLYVPAQTRPVDVAAIIRAAGRRAATIDRRRFQTAPAERFGWFAAAALALLLIEPLRRRSVILPFGRLPVAFRRANRAGRAGASQADVAEGASGGQSF